MRFEEEVGRFIYRPPQYYNRTMLNKSTGGNGLELDLCRECYLRPCLTKGMWSDIMGVCEEAMVFNCNNNGESVYYKMVDYAEGLLGDVFGAEYVRLHEPPNCLHRLVRAQYETKMELEEEDEHPDDGLVAGATDAKDYMD